MIDSHCHLATPSFAEDLDAVVDRARAAGLTRVFCILAADDAAEEAQAARLVSLWPDVRFAVGIHPHQAGDFASRTEQVVDVVAAALERVPGARAVGEIGLDYHYDFAPREVQREVFRSQVRLARNRGLPVVIHSREAEDEALAILEEENLRAAGGVFHCFTGGTDVAARVLAGGFHLSFAGIVTFTRADALREIARTVPGDRLLVETDAPFLAPVPHRGRRNEPARVTHVIDAIARVREESPALVGERAARTFEALFRP